MGKFIRSLWLYFFVAICWTPLVGGQTEGIAKNYFVNGQLPYHKAVLDSLGKLVAWYHPDENLGYDNFIRLDWDFLEHKVPLEVESKVKVYLVYPVYDPDTLQGDKSALRGVPGAEWQHNPA